METWPNPIDEERQHLLEHVGGLVLYTGDPDGTEASRLRHGCGPIHYAAKNRFDNRNVVTMLLNLEANIHLRNCFQQTALHVAAYFRNRNIVETLLRRGASHRLLDADGNTPLHMATYNCVGRSDPSQLPIVESFLERNANVNVRNNLRDTPLMHAAQCYSLDVVKALLRAGADVRHKNKAHQTCVHCLFLAPGRKDKKGKDAIRYIVDSEKHNLSQMVEDVKEVVKIATLVNCKEKVQFSVHRRISYRIGRFNEECYAEVQRMRCITLPYTRSLTLCDFALPGCDVASRNMNGVFAELMEQNFQIYNDYLADHFETEFLEGKLSSEVIYAGTEDGLKDIPFPHHLAFDLYANLSKTDLYNLTNVIRTSYPSRF